MADCRLLSTWCQLGSTWESTWVGLGVNLGQLGSTLGGAIARESSLILRTRRYESEGPIRICRRQEDKTRARNPSIRSDVRRFKNLESNVEDIKLVSRRQGFSRSVDRLQLGCRLQIFTSTSTSTSTFHTPHSTVPHMNVNVNWSMFGTRDGGGEKGGGGLEGGREGGVRWVVGVEVGLVGCFRLNMLMCRTNRR